MTVHKLTLKAIKNHNYHKYNVLVMVNEIYRKDQQFKNVKKVVRKWGNYKMRQIHIIFLSCLMTCWSSFLVKAMEPKLMKILGISWFGRLIEHKLWKKFNNNKVLLQLLKVKKWKTKTKLWSWWSPLLKMIVLLFFKRLHGETNIGNACL